MPATVFASVITCSVATKTAWGAEWVVQRDVDVDTVRFATAPAGGAATLSMRYGLIAIVGEDRRLVAPLDLRGQLVRVCLTGSDRDTDATTLTWYGVVRAQSDDIQATSSMPLSLADPTPTAVHSGRTLYTVAGLEAELDRGTLTRSRTNQGWVEDVLPFNVGVTVGGQLMGNRATATTEAAYRFHDTQRELWTALEVANYLLALASDWTGQTWALSGQCAALATITDVWEFPAGTTLLEALHKVISPRYGFTWLLDTDATDWPPPLKVVSCVDIAFDVAPVHIPANEPGIGWEVDTPADLEQVILEAVEGSHFDQVTARGGPLRVCCTLSAADGSLVAGWTTGQESDYNASEANTHLASLAAVYRHLVLPLTWDGVAYGGAPALPLYAPAATPPVDTDHLSTKYFRGWVLDPVIAQSYVDDSTGLPRWRPPQAFVEVDTSAHTWRALEDASEEASWLGPGVALSMLRDRAGVQLHAAFGHLFGMNHYSGPAFDFPAYDWQRLLVTAMFATNDRCQVTVTSAAVGGSATPGPTPAVKVIEVPGAEVWYLAPGTVVGVHGTSLVTTGDAATPRNDTLVLQQVATAAATWYGRRRTRLKLRQRGGYLLTFGGTTLLGRVLTEVYAGGAVTALGTLVTSISYHLAGKSQVLELASDWADLDFAHFARKASGNLAGGAALGAGRNRASTETMPQLVSLPGTKDGDRPVWAKVTSGPTGGHYLASVYRFRADTTALKTGATVTVYDLPSGVTLPANTWLLAWPVAGGYGAAAPAVVAVKYDESTHKLQAGGPDGAWHDVATAEVCS